MKLLMKFMLPLAKFAAKQKVWNMLVDTDTLHTHVVLRLCQPEKDAREKEWTSEEEYTKSKQVVPKNKIVKEKFQKPIREKSKWNWNIYQI